MGPIFTVDEQISAAMGSDYDILILISGRRGTAKLKSNLHTPHCRSFPLRLESLSPRLGLVLTCFACQRRALACRCAPQAIADDLSSAGIALAEEDHMLDGVVLTADGTDVEAWVASVMALVATYEPEVEEDAQAA